MSKYNNQFIGVGITGSIFFIIMVVILCGNINITNKYQKEIINQINNIRTQCSDTMTLLNHTKFAQNTVDFYAYNDKNLDNAPNILKYSSDPGYSEYDACIMAIDYWKSYSFDSNSVNIYSAINWKNATEIGVRILFDKKSNTYSIYVALLSPDYNVNHASELNSNIICPI